MKIIEDLLIKLNFFKINLILYSNYLQLIKNNKGSAPKGLNIEFKPVWMI